MQINTLNYISQKLVLVLTTFTLVTSASKKAQDKVRVLDYIPCIFYPMQFQNDKSKDTLALIKFGGKVNAMILTYTAKLGLKVLKTDVGA